MTHFTRDTTGKEVVEAFAGHVKGKTSSHSASVRDRHTLIFILVLITGASRGSIGAETALSLAHGQPKTLFLAGRSESKVLPVMQQIHKVSAATTVEFVEVDLDNQSSIRKAAAELQQKLGRDSLDILIANAGIIGQPHMERTAEGVESQFGVNHLSHFLLCNLLLGKLMDAGKAGRIVNLTSSAYEGAGVNFKDAKYTPGINFSDINFNDGKTYNRWSSYSQSKCANMLFTTGLVGKYGGRGLTAFSVHPGVVNGTGLAAHITADEFKEVRALAPQVVQKTGRPFRPDPAKNIQQACSTTLVAALDPVLSEHNGAHLRDCNIFDDVVGFAKDPIAADKLWRLSEELVGQKFPG
ncbi:hypothetical protein MMC13_003332 [Lambiella insularis]|nr:hypothetical protein [Lambiella insularis]